MYQKSSQYAFYSLDVAIHFSFFVVKNTASRLEAEARVAPSRMAMLSKYSDTPTLVKFDIFFDQWWHTFYVISFRSVVHQKTRKFLLTFWEWRKMHIHQTWWLHVTACLVCSFLNNYVQSVLVEFNVL